MALRTPAIAIGFQETHFISNPPKLQRAAAATTKPMALDRFPLVPHQIEFDG
jgi:hypothetical protein